MEETREVKTFEVDFRCEKCKVGYMRPTGIVLDSNPPMYPHVCNECGHHHTFIDKRYPHKEYQYNEQT